MVKPEYSSVEAVQNLSFQTEEGELLGFIGLNGVGKSTTIKMLTFGIYPITLFDSYAKLILFTHIPAALVGAVPAAFIRAFT